MSLRQYCNCYLWRGNNGTIHIIDNGHLNKTNWNDTEEQAMYLKQECITVVNIAGLQWSCTLETFSTISKQRGDVAIIYFKMLFYYTDTFGTDKVYFHKYSQHYS